MTEETLSSQSSKPTEIPTPEKVRTSNLEDDIGVFIPKVGTIVSSATPSIYTDFYDMFTITALATAITSFTTNLQGTPKAGEKLIIRIKDDGTARAITWGTKFASRGATLPTTTVLGKYMYCGFIWNEVVSVWDLVALSNET